METLFIYFLKANGLLITFFLVYYFLLRKETFFTKNRWFLILGLVASVLLPLITFTTIVWVEPTPIVYKPTSFESIPYLIENQIKEIPFDWNSFFVYAYILISVVFLAKMIIELFSFFRIIKVGNRSKSNQTILIDTNQNTNPFSFFTYIVFNSKLFTEEELHHIISHENIHVQEKHSIDVLLGKLFCAIFWINPIIWFYRKEMLQNLEYIADNKASSIAQNRINYQKTLLKVVTNQHQLSITNQFYQSLIKKRIVMLNTKQSNQKKSWKYVLILPVLSAFMLLFQVEILAQVKENPLVKTSYVVSTNYTSTVTRNTTNQELKEVEASFSDENQKLIISNVKRNKKGEIIEIKLLFDTGKTYYRVMERISKEPIDPIEIFIKTDKEGNKDCGFEEIDLSAIYVSKVLEEPKIISSSKMYSKVISAYSVNLVLDNLKIFYEMHFGIDITFNNITRNKENEITGIDVTLTNKKGTSYDYKVSSNKPIKPFSIFATVEKDENQKFGFSTSVNYNDLKKSIEVFEQNKISSNSKQFVLSMEEKNGKYVMKSAPESDVFMEEFSLEDNGAFLKNSLTILDGKIISTEELNKIDPNSIKSVTVVKRARNANARYEELFKKYGELAENGIIEIKTNDFKEPVEKE